MARYVVTAPYVTVRTMTEQGARVLGLYADAPVPKDAPEDWVKNHLAAKMIAEVEDPAQAVSAVLTPLEVVEAAGQPGGALGVAHARVVAGERGRGRAARPGGRDADKDTGADGDKADGDDGKAAAPAVARPGATPQVKK